MPNRWIKKQLEETDDLTFAMSILSERGSRLNPNTPLGKKLKRAQGVLEELCDACCKNPFYASGEISVMEALYRASQDRLTLDDLTCRIKEYEENDINLSDLAPEAVLADAEIMKRIAAKFDSSDCNNSYWDNMDNAIEEGIAEILTERAGAAPV
jgi:hypothetical protein